MTIRVEIPRQDLMTAEKTASGWQIEAVGCLELLTRIRILAQQNPNPELWPLPEGQDHVDLFLREFILKTRGEWQFPYNEEELCHCRNVPTAVVDRAIMNGAHTGIAVSRQTSASTGCGTCRPQVERIIDYRRSGCLKACKKAS